MLKTYEEKIKTIKNEIRQIGEIVLKANKTSLKALKDNDINLLKDIDLSLKKLVSKSNEIDNLIVTTLALYSPEAKDLRHMVSYLKITNELVRAGTNSKIFIKTFRKSFSDELDETTILEYAIPLQKAAASALEITLSMLDETNEKLIEESFNKVLVEESKTDDLYAMVEKNILKLISKNQELSRDYFNLLSSLRKLEKCADRATSIANLIVFAYIGGELEQ
ncbi:phosphate signaling complex PhoU family protein [Malaciobacter marinus]|uniref:PhoU family transcriptional regulator n=1 Tax=Malaciobacter marinus TaxID=505249 RepID=A0A347THC8_9BACT|nr:MULTISPECIES: PhoU domain-containing protein [Malaciobacter]AXX86006.1 phosphate transport system regulatory protein [Malaciobacter marinus]PHO12610.1 PhoU family transcriptional regulator [Malaciobacter marinus]PHO15270.1 PhoU family transcriptional regulator [Malaciobacter marinus]RYA23218.1 PhoU family transcriptional regulator [Malaciobacter halophilus]